MLVPDTSFGYGDEDMAKQKVRFGGAMLRPSLVWGALLQGTRPVPSRWVERSKRARCF